MSRYDLGLDELADLLGDAPRFRAQQLYNGLYTSLAEPGEIHVLPAPIRRELAANEGLKPALLLAREASADDGATTKWLFRLDGDDFIETVLMHHPKHSTACISSQAGCAMACQFCATGDAGYSRQLSVGEIVEQVVWAARSARASGRRLNNVVFMGMGEPMSNLPRVFGAVERIIGDLGIGARHLTISTVGIIPGIDAFAKRPEQVNLAVSLHAANDELRDELIPINRRYPLARLYDSLERYMATTHRRVTFEWALMDGVNDRDSDVEELAEFALGLSAHVNVIPLNATVGADSRGLRGSPAQRVRSFCDALTARRVNATIRRTRGSEIAAACGQLAGATASEVALSLGAKPRVELNA
ncbi:MAG TPA: 23S rRNA (adenine(2503)-C(2))-methyltransferase RlmN [Acidimicrobiales bacterium]